jgi:mRNA interferase MazF
MSEGAGIQRGDLIIAELGDARGGQIRKRRPYVVVSPDELNAVRSTYIAVPLTTGNHPYRFRVPCEAMGRKGFVVLDQVYAVPAEAVRQPVGRLAPDAMRTVLARLREMFAE